MPRRMGVKNRMRSPKKKHRSLTDENRVKLLEPDAYPGRPPESIDSQGLSFFANLRSGCFELLRIKLKKGGEDFYVVLPFTDTGYHITFHESGAIHARDKSTDARTLKQFDPESAYRSIKRFVRWRSGCFCLRVGRKLRNEELQRTLSLLLRFLPLKEDLPSLTRRLLKEGFVRFVDKHLF